MRDALVVSLPLLCKCFAVIRVERRLALTCEALILFMKELAGGICGVFVRSLKDVESEL